MAALLEVALRVVARLGLAAHVAGLTPSLGGAGEPTLPDRALPTPPHACLAPRGARAAPAPAHRLMSRRVVANLRASSEPSSGDASESEHSDDSGAVGDSGSSSSD